MSDEPELKMSTRQKVLNPLTISWGIVLVSLALLIGWLMLSEAPMVAPEEMADTSNNQPEIDEVTAPPQVEAVTGPEIPDIVADPKSLLLASSQTALSPAPNPNLLIRSDNGMLPSLGPDGLVAWKEYARPFSGDEEKPRIAIMVTDLGLNSKSSNAAIDMLPGQVDLAFSPYGRNLQNWMDQARSKGHEGFLMVPTEPLNYPESDPGPHTLLVDLSARENINRLDWILSRVGGYVGVVNHMGSKFTASEEAMNAVIGDLNSRGLMLVDARSTRFSLAARTARREGMPRAMNDRYIDNVLTPVEIKKQLSELEKTAKTFGAALGIARAIPLTINEIAEWSLSLQEKGIELVPVTAIANRQPIK
ncbi:MAG: divergent polysaccharide deacetylase family protein [Emcibacteraceae bacterium]|nr:divergent polysaccharide deacetylase family protein [Emcibacteraceae bacterium]MDG1996660.1 divergent polysaccharide deacetylase family protein [Emcibacteraceae bacterium]